MSPEALRASPGACLRTGGAGSAASRCVAAVACGGCAGGRRWWWWCAGLKAAATGGGASGLEAAAACGESGVHGTAASGAAEPAGGLLSPADFRRAVEMLPLVSIDLLLHDGQGRYLTGLRSNPPAGRLVRARQAHPQERAAGAGAGPHRPRGTGPARNGRRLDALRRPRAFLLHQLRRRNQPLHPLHRAGLRGRAGAGSGQPAARAASRLPLAVARRHRRRP